MSKFDIFRKVFFDKVEEFQAQKERYNTGYSTLSDEIITLFDKSVGEAHTEIRRQAVSELKYKMSVRISRSK